jgi:hypothetical protein
MLDRRRAATDSMAYPPLEALDRVESFGSAFFNSHNLSFLLYNTFIITIGPFRLPGLV